MNPWILGLIIAVTIANWQGGLGILTGIAIIYLVLADKEGKRNIEKRLWSWGGAYGTNNRNTRCTSGTAYQRYI
jgi:hypothetical protein